MGVEFSDGRVSFGTCGRVLVGHWRAPFSRERLCTLERLATGLHGRHGANIGMVGVFESDAIELAALSDDGLRREGARVMTELASKVAGGIGIVLEGNGFAVAALRAAALTLQSLSRSPERPVFHPSAPVAIDWLVERLAIGPAARTEIAALLSELRGLGMQPHAP